MQSIVCFPQPVFSMSRSPNISKINAIKRFRHWTTCPLSLTYCLKFNLSKISITATIYLSAKKKILICPLSYSPKKKRWPVHDENCLKKYIYGQFNNRLDILSEMWLLIGRVTYSVNFVRTHGRVKSFTIDNDNKIHVPASFECDENRRFF